MSDRVCGTVKWFDERKGYGFIDQDIGGDIIVHYGNFQGEGFRTLNEGQRVEFEVVHGIKGAHAYDVVVLGES